MAPSKREIDAPLCSMMATFASLAGPVDGRDIVVPLP